MKGHGHFPLSREQPRVQSWDSLLPRNRIRQSSSIHLLKPGKGLQTWDA